MSTLAIPPQRVQLYRALWDRWIIVLRILFDLGAGAHPVKWRSVADVLMVDKKTCQKYVDGLVREGRIALAGNGYMLTESGMGVLFENEQGEIPPLGGKNLGENFSPLVKESVVVNSELNPLTTTPTKLGKNPEEIFSPEVRLALEHLPDLFDGSEVTTKGLPTYLHPEKVLGWIAYAYDKRNALSAPCGLIYSKLKDASAPSPSIKYMRTPESYLPNEYLSAIGRFSKACPRCEVIYTDAAEYEQHQTSCLFTPQDEDSNDLPETEVDGIGRHRLWLEILNDERITRITNQRGSMLTAFGREPVVFDGVKMQVGFRDPETLSRYKNRLTDIASQVLRDILDRDDAMVTFVAVETDEE